jgi:CelD/BcsL family acetyltransferase involved in cellulose biosynthesis
MAELLDFLTKVESPDWRVLDLYNLLDSSPTLPALQSAAEVRGCQVLQEPLQHCPYIPLPEDWDTYLSGVDKKQRHEIRRKMRRAGDHVVPLRWYIVEDENRLDGEIDAFFNLMAQDPKKDKFLTEAMRRQMRETTHIAFREGWLQFAFLDVGREKAAAYLNFDYLDRIWVYNSGIDSRFRELSLGWVLLGYLIQWAIEHKRKAYDFMRGDEDYKYRFGGVDRRVIRMQVRR